LPPQSPQPPGYQGAMDFIYGRVDFERQAPTPGMLRLRRMQALLDRLGNPDRAVGWIHLAGTKGKGSTATMLAQILTAAGYRTGLYTSPHLTHLEERFRVNGLPCPPATLVELVDRLRPACESLSRTDHGPPTFFELTTALAMLHFQRSGCQWGVLEVGLGGRLDSTNVCKPVITAITSIGLDHQQLLGNTLGEIAREKAGIIKPSVPIICGVPHGPAAHAILHVAHRRQAPCLQLGKHFHYRVHDPPPEPWGTVLDYGPTHQLRSIIDRSIAPPTYGVPRFGHPVITSRHGIRLRMEGRHQARNATIALAIADLLIHQGTSIPETAIRHGLATAQSPARLQRIDSDPPILLDTAHNPDSIEALTHVIKNRLASHRPIVIFAASRDKDTAAMLALLAPHVDHIVFTKYLLNPRACDPQALIAQLPSSSFNHWTTHSVATSPQAALDKALAIARTDQPNHSPGRTTSTHHHPSNQRPAMIIITGSFFLAAEILPHLATEMRLQHLF
jgi:dihydrofolate synthase / folylpolyglutamate synthase